MDLIEKIGPVLGIAAFFGLSVLAFLLFQQSRDVRRLREWAGRAPERAKEAADASLAASEARGEAQGEEKPSRLAALRSSVAGTVGPRYEAIDRRLPVDGRYLMAVVLVIVVAAVLTSGFGLVGDDGKGGGGKQGSAQKPKIAVLNATQSATAPPVPGLAHSISTGVVKPAGYRVVTEDNAPAGLANTTVMYAGHLKSAADRFAKKIRPKLGESAVTKMSPEVKASAKGAKVALLVGLDDSTFGG
jgi:hypothetical protein